MIHLEITAKQSTLNFVLPNLEAIAVVDRGMEGKQAVVHMTSLVLAVLLRNQDNLKLFGTLADKDQTSLAKAFEEFGAHSQIKSLSKTEDHHYYSHQMHLYMLKKESEEMSKNLISAGRICSEISRDVNELDSLQIDYDNMHSKMRVVQEDQDKCFADLEHLELEYAKLTKDLEKNQAETQKASGEQHHVTSLVMGDQRHLAAHWRDTNKDQEVKLEIKETQLSEIYMNFWLTQSKYDCIQQEELANTLQIVQVKDTKIRTLEEQLSSQSREENSSLADQTAILELREKNSEVLAEKLILIIIDRKAALKQVEALILVLCGSQNETTTTSESIFTTGKYYYRIKWSLTSPQIPLSACTNALVTVIVMVSVARAQLLQAQNSLDLVLQQPVVPHPIVMVLLEFHTAVLQRRNRLNHAHNIYLRLEEEHRNLGAIHALGCERHKCKKDMLNPDPHDK
ncbi:hypothetical protein B0H13DRAFT_1885551 [Mycena leptocephala]|nr:hypothetical protein B0H13DRAFT_1885551 [Mycena leptocephala]